MRTKSRIQPMVGLLLLTMTACGGVLKKAHNEDGGGQPILIGSSVIELPARPEPETPGTPKLTEATPANVTPAAVRVAGQVTLKKSEIFGRTFLYGFDLQYSSAGNAKYSLLDQSMALGHIPAMFRQFGNKLQLVADNSRLFESVVNHPETLINEYKVISESDGELTITMDHSGLLVHKTLNGVSAAPPADQWLRSIEYVEAGNYFLQESAIMLATGEVQLVMESLFPRETLVPAGYVGIEDDRDANEDAKRFMMISNEKVYVERSKSNGVPVREQTAYGNRYNLKDSSSTIDWYVTANAPDELMGELKSGVVGWNRYFNEQQGRDVVRFMGRLPDNIKIGDPRYNVINFDTVAKAGAAYESQASDPLTGIQSHSLIYMPYAWYNIAAGLIKNREIPETKSEFPLIKRGPQSPEVLFGSARQVVRCVRDAAELELAAPLGASADVIDDFGRRVFISTLFHEMGHAMGLGHNFKGSLAFDGTKPEATSTNPTTYSVMDYNYYQHELDLFTVIGGSEGPKLEYDRQAMSFLYNKGANIAATDKVIPSCNDEDADSKEEGIDPNCIRYDAESNPLIGLAHASGRFTDKAGALGLETKTLSQMIDIQRGVLVASLLDAAVAKDATTAEDIVKKRLAGLTKLISYYVAVGAQSVRVNLTLNAGAMRAWKNDASTDGIVMPESERRLKYVQTLETFVKMTDLPAEPHAAVEELVEGMTKVISEAERFGTVEERKVLVGKLAEKIIKVTKESAVSSLARVRGGVAEKLAYDPELPFASGLIDGRTAEHIAVSALADIVVSDLTKDEVGDANLVAERTKAAGALKSFLAVDDDFKPLVLDVRAKLKVILLAAKDSNQVVVDHVRTLLAQLTVSAD